MLVQTQNNCHLQTSTHVGVHVCVQFPYKMVDGTQIVPNDSTAHVQQLITTSDNVMQSTDPVMNGSTTRVQGSGQ